MTATARVPGIGARLRIRVSGQSEVRTESGVRMLIGTSTVVDAVKVRCLGNHEHGRVRGAV